MNIAENYRSTYDNREIVRILQRSSALEGNVLWQSHGQGKTVIPIQHFEIDFVGREVVVTFNPRRHTVDRKLPLYVKLEYRTTVFKVGEFREEAAVLSFSLPRELKTLELRSFPRQQFSADREYTVALKPSLTGNRDAGNELEVRALDVSRYGLGLLVSEHNRSFLKNNRILWLTKLGPHRLQYPILGEVVYINSDVDHRHQTRRPKELKVGLKLSGVLPPDVFNAFIV
jgi:hypothetical protein